jgi:hypothetical protein
VANTAEHQRWLAFLGTPDCPCPTEWKSLGVLYGVSFGKGWVRMSTDPRCPHHAEARRVGEADGG